MKYYIFSYSYTKYDGVMGNQCVVISSDVVVDSAHASVSIAKHFKYAVVIPFLFQEISETGYHEHTEQFNSKKA